MILNNNIMWNKQLRDRFDAVWSSLKGLKAGEIEYQIEMSRRIAQPVLGTSDIDKLRNSSLLRLLLYEFIIFADEKCLEKTTQSLKRSTVSSSNQSNSDISITSIKDLKEILSSVEKRRDASGYYQMEKYEFKTLKRRVKSIEQELKESSIQSRPVCSGSHDPEGTEAMIEQLEHLLKKKQKRIKELNCQLEENFEDKEDLQMEIQALEKKNLELQQTTRMLDEECTNIRGQFQKYKTQQKEELLFGASEFMNGGFSRKNSDLSKEDSLQQRPSSPVSPQLNQLLSSAQVLSKYVNSSMEKQGEIIETPQKVVQIQQKTVKKACITRVISEEYHGQEEENLLESMRIYRKKSQISQKTDFLQDNQHSLDRMLLAQAAFIERVMESII